MQSPPPQRPSHKTDFAPGFSRPLRLGTRASELALAQAELVRALFCAAHDLPKEAVEIHKLTTKGDRFVERPLSAIGGKGLFTRELEDALLGEAIDLAVHSAKDVATILPDRLELAAFLPREDVRDVLISPLLAQSAPQSPPQNPPELGPELEDAPALDFLPGGAVFGSSSLRRRSQMLGLRPDLTIVDFRGTVGTRLKKLEDKIADCTLLAMAGLNRLGRKDLFDKGLAAPISSELMLPALAQGAITIEIRQGDARMRGLIEKLDDQPTRLALIAERRFLYGLDGSCRTPIAGLATIEGTNMTLRGEVLSLDGSSRISGVWSGDDPLELGARAAEDLIKRGAAALLEEVASAAPKQGKR